MLWIKSEIWRRKIKEKGIPRAAEEGILLSRSGTGRNGSAEKIAESKRRRKRQYIKPCLFISYHIFYVHPWDISRISRRGGYQKRYQGGLRELKRRSKIFFDLLLF